MVIRCSTCASLKPAFRKINAVCSPRLGTEPAEEGVVEKHGTGAACILTELLLPIATTAFQTIPMARAMVAPRTAADAEAYRNATGRLINTCHALREDSPVAIFLKN